MKFRKERQNDPKLLSRVREGLSFVCIMCLFVALGLGSYMAFANSYTQPLWIIASALLVLMVVLMLMSEKVEALRQQAIKRDKRGK